jgi:hypothetical protein
MISAQCLIYFAQILNTKHIVFWAVTMCSYKNVPLDYPQSVFCH